MKRSLAFSHMLLTSLGRVDDGGMVLDRVDEQRREEHALVHPAKTSLLPSKVTTTMRLMLGKVAVSLVVSFAPCDAIGVVKSAYGRQPLASDGCVGKPEMMEPSNAAEASKIANMAGANTRGVVAEGSHRCQRRRPVSSLNVACLGWVSCPGHLTHAAALAASRATGRIGPPSRRRNQQRVEDLGEGWCDAEPALRARE